MIVLICMGAGMAILVFSVLVLMGIPVVPRRKPQPDPFWCWA